MSAPKYTDQQRFIDALLRDTLARECCAENRNRLLAVIEAVQRATQNIDLERKEPSK